MQSLKYVMAKSMELTSKLELSSVVSSVRSGHADAASSASSVAGSDALAARSTGDTNADMGHGREGEAFLLEHRKDWDVVLVHHRKLLQSGEVLSDELARARKRLQDQVESEAYMTQHFHEIKRVREQLGTIRGLVEKIAEDAEHVEQYLMHQTEEYMATQNALFVVQQERELDLFEERILEEKEDRKKLIVAARRDVLAKAFQNDLKTYQTLVAYQGPVVTQRAVAAPQEEESLESVDLVVTTDPASLEAFYDTEDDDEGALRFPDEEEKAEEKEDDDDHEQELNKTEEKEEDDVVEAATASASPPVEQAASVSDDSQVVGAKEATHDDPEKEDVEK